jgi:pyruvate kinase
MMTSAFQHRARRTKIVATLGPATSSPDAIKALFLAGADVFRFNFSHGTHADHAARMKIVRDLEQEIGRPICVIGDLQGPKLRVGTFKDGAVTLEVGQSFRLDRDTAPGDATRVCLPHPEIFAAIKPGLDLLMDDGKIRMRVIAHGPDWAEMMVISGTRLSDRKGVNVPGTVLDVSPLTTKDRADMTAALDMGVDWIALSFVQRPADVIEARGLIGGRAALMVKLEKPSAIDCLEELIDLADGAMVARGDLGVEMNPEDVPSIQKRILRLGRLAGKPVIVATQMLESMISAPAPTRAEASDVATAVYDGTDAVMLSAETASGQYPIEAVAMMERIARRIEGDDQYHRIMEAQHPDLDHTTADAISAAARQVAHTIGAAAIVTYTTSGSTTLRAVRERPEVPILCLTSKHETARRMALSFGVHAVHTEDAHSFNEMVSRATTIARRDGLALSGDKIVITAGVPFGTPGNTNILRIAGIE